MRSGGNRLPLPVNPKQPSLSSALLTTAARLAAAALLFTLALLAFTFLFVAIFLLAALVSKAASLPGSFGLCRASKVPFVLLLTSAWPHGSLR